MRSDACGQEVSTGAEPVPNRTRPCQTRASPRKPFRKRSLFDVSSLTSGRRSLNCELTGRPDFQFQTVRVFYENRCQPSRVVAIFTQDRRAFLLEIRRHLIDGIRDVTVVMNARPGG